MAPVITSYSSVHVSRLNSDGGSFFSQLNILAVSFVQNSQASHPDPTCPANQRKQLFVSARERDPKFLPLSDVEGPWRWPLVVSGIDQNGIYECRIDFLEKNVVSKDVDQQIGQTVRKHSYKVVCLPPYTMLVY